MSHFFHLYLCFSLLFFLVQCGFCVNLNKTCAKIVQGDPYNVKFDFCVTSLQVVPENHRTSLRELGNVSLNLTKSNASHTLGYINNLLKRNMKPDMKSCLTSCQELYANSISSLNEAMNCVGNQHFDDANIQVTAAMDAPTTCEDGFREGKGTVSPLSKRNSDAFQLGAISLTIINMLSK
ncbi:hypothetical protein ACHQM5_007584 [Ranunculus cassubicifolius]